MPNVNLFTERAFAHIHQLSVTIGGRGSCSLEERQASEYVADQMKSLGVEDVHLETFQAIPSTYQPFALAFAISLTGALVVLFLDGEGANYLACVLNVLGMWAVLAEADLRSHWGRWLLPKARSQNVVGFIRPFGPMKGRVVLCAHLDTHRTAIFFSSDRWYKAFSTLLGVVFFSIILAAVAFGLGAFLDWEWARWIGLSMVPLQIFALVLCLHADFTPFSPGANDNASGVGVILGIVERLMDEPLKNIDIHLTINGCEEVGAYGMTAFLDQHAQELGKETVYIILDEVGFGELHVLTADGILTKHKTHPQALELARQVVDSDPDLRVKKKVGIAYTDALMATKRGLVALSVFTLPDSAGGQATHWHRMTDTVSNVDMKSLDKTHDFVWKLLQTIDRKAE